MRRASGPMLGPAHRVTAQPMHTGNGWFVVVTDARMPGLNELLDARSSRWAKGDAYWQLKLRWHEVFHPVRAAVKRASWECERRVTHIDVGWFENACSFNGASLRPRDPDNIIAGGSKILIDSLVAMGLFAGDGPRWLGDAIFRHRVLYGPGQDLGGVSALILFEEDVLVRDRARSSTRAKRSA